MKRAFSSLMFALLVGVSLAETATVSQVLTSPAKFDKKVVTVRGVVGNFKSKTSKKGNPYTTFEVKEGAKLLSVYLQGKLPKEPKNGMNVIVTGTFQVEKKVGTQTFKNEIDATAKGAGKNGVVLAEAAKSTPKPVAKPGKKAAH